MFHWNRRRWLTLAFVLVSLLTITSAVRAIRHARHLHARTDEPIQGWMNIPYIAHAYHVRPDVIHQALGLPPDRRDRRPLRKIAETQGRPLDALISDIMAAIRRDRESRPSPAGASPPVEQRSSL